VIGIATETALETEVGFLGPLRVSGMTSPSVSAELGILEETVVPCTII
jgi:hypothetical protein